MVSFIDSITFLTIMYRSLELQNKTKDLAINIFDSYLIQSFTKPQPSLTPNLKIMNGHKSRNNTMKGSHTRKFGNDISNFTINTGMAFY